MSRYELPPHLETTRLILKPVEMQYAQSVFDVFDDEVTKHMFPVTPEKVEDTQQFIRDSIKKNEAGKEYTVFIFDKETNELIGGSGLHRLDTRTPELGIWIKIAAHGHKYGREAVTALKEWADENVDYDYLLYPAAVENIASRKIAESLGGRVARTYDDSNQNGRPMHLVEYRIYKNKATQIREVEDLSGEIIKRAKNRSPYVVAITGFGGSGKTTLSDKLSSLLTDSTIIHADDFITADEKGAKEGHLHDWDKLEELLFKRLKSEDKVVSRIYDWPSNKQVHEELPVTKYMIIDGPLGLLQARFLPYIDLTVWLDVPQEVANARGKKRDNEEFHADHDDLWDNVWTPLEKKGFEKLRPDLKADIHYKSS